MGRELGEVIADGVRSYDEPDYGAAF